MVNAAALQGGGGLTPHSGKAQGRRAGGGEVRGGGLMEDEDLEERR